MTTMMSDRLRDFLEAQAIPYHLIVHRRDYTAQGAAADTHTPGREFVKTVLLAVDNRFMLAALAANQRVDMARVRRELGANDVHLASESEMAELCPDCEVGALPPTGSLYGLPVLMSQSLAEDDQLTFNAGTHECAVRMHRPDFERLESPRVMDLAMQED